MNVTHRRKKILTSAVGAAITGVAASALLFLGAGTAHAIQDVSEGTPRDAIGTLMAFKCPVPPPTPLSPCEQSPSLSWWPGPQPTAVAAQGWLAP